MKLDTPFQLNDAGKVTEHCNPAMCSGFGMHHTNEADPSKPEKQLKPYTTITVAEVRALVDTPHQTDKATAQWLIPSSLMVRNVRRQEKDGKFYALWADIDQGTKEDPFYLDDPRHVTFDQIHGIVTFEILDGFDFELYTSRSATKQRHKCRLFIPLDKPLGGADWKAAQAVLNAKLNDCGILPDEANLVCHQLMYLPNRGAYYVTANARNDIYLDPLKDWADQMANVQHALTVKVAEVEKHKAEALNRRQSLNIAVSSDLIGAFNQSFAVEEVLTRAGYDQRGDTFRHPHSESGSYSASVKDGRVHSLSSSDPLYTKGAGEGAHDAFSAFSVLFAGSDQSEALKLAGNEWITINGESWNTVRQREYRQANTADSVENIITELVDLEVKPKQHDFNLDWPPGLAGDVAKYIFDSSRMPTKSFAIAGALQVLSYINANRQWVAPSDTALNLYHCLIGVTGKGKEDPRKAIKRLAGAVMFSTGISESTSSGPALLRSLEDDKEQLILTDEFGIFIQVALSEKGSFHQKELVKELLTLYGLGRSYYAGRKYADKKNNIPQIDRPYVNLFGTTTPTELIDGVNSKSIDNGFLNRILFVAAGGEGEINRSPHTDVPESLGKRLEAIAQDRTPHNGLMYRAGAHELMVKLSEQMGVTGEYENLWSRSEEQMIRVAGILAIEEGGIGMEHVEWAARYVNWSINSFSEFLGNDLAESVYEKGVVKARNIINQAKSYSSDNQFQKWCRLGYMPRGKLSKLMRLKPRDLDDVINHLISTGEVQSSVYDGSTIYHPPLPSSENSQMKRENCKKQTA